MIYTHILNRGGEGLIAPRIGHITAELDCELLVCCATVYPTIISVPIALTAATDPIRSSGSSASRGLSCEMELKKAA